MNPETARWIRMSISALTSGIIGAAGIVLQATASGEIKGITWTIAGITGIMLLAKDLQSYLSQPPPSLGGAPIITPPPVAGH